MTFGVWIIPLRWALLVHCDPQWAANWQGGVLAGSSSTSPYSHHGTERAGSCGQEECQRGGGKWAEREAILEALNNIFLCSVFFLQLGLEARLRACLGPDSGILLNSNRKQQGRKAAVLLGKKIFFPVSFFFPFLLPPHAPFSCIFVFLSIPGC